MFLEKKGTLEMLTPKKIPITIVCSPTSAPPHGKNTLCPFLNLTLRTGIILEVVKRIERNTGSRCKDAREKEKVGGL
jgi:hypothetical protein